MINIITKSNKYKMIRDSESFVGLYVIPSEFSDLDLYAMKEIDGAELIDKNLGTIVTRFGITDISHLSTGCQVVLSYLYMIRHKDEFRGTVLEVTECGYNALEVLFQCADKLGDSDTVFYLGHESQLRRCNDREYCINGNICSSLYEGMLYYG